MFAHPGFVFLKPITSGCSCFALVELGLVFYPGCRILFCAMNPVFIRPVKLRVFVAVDVWSENEPRCENLSTTLPICTKTSIYPKRNDPDSPGSHPTTFFLLLLCFSKGLRIFFLLSIQLVVCMGSICSVFFVMCWCVFLSHSLPLVKCMCIFLLLLLF